MIGYALVAGCASGSEPDPDLQTASSAGGSRGGPATQGPPAADAGGVEDGPRYPAVPPDSRIDYDIRPPNPRATGLYKVLETRNLAAPGANPSGITFDGAFLWIIFPYEGTAPKLVQYDPAAAMVVRELEVKALAATPKLGVFGITWDGRSIWISAQSKIVEVSPDDGSVRRTFSSPADSGPSDLDFDGQDLWLSTGTGDIFLIDRTNGGIKRRFKTIQPSLRDNGVAWRSGELWVGGLFGGLDVHDPATGKHTHSVVEKSDQFVDGVEFGMLCFARDELVVLNRLGITYYRPERLK